MSQSELKPIFVGSYTSQVLENDGYYATVLGFHFALEDGKRVFV